MSKPTRNRVLAKARNSRPSESGVQITCFGNANAIFMEDKEDNQYLHIIKAAKSSGQLNLSNRGLSKVPQKVYNFYEVEDDKRKNVVVDMSSDADDKWWEHNELSKLFLASNSLVGIDPLIRNLSSLQLLDLSDNKVTNLPEELKELKDLEKLLLSHNDFEQLPEWICEMEELKFLSVDHNNLKSLPKNIGSLCLLEQLDASYNGLCSVPPSLGYLQRLHKLSLSDNKIQNLPEELGDMFGLVHLDLTRNELDSLPESLSNLHKLENLSMRQNRMTKLPALACPNLKEIYLGANQIKELEVGSLEALSALCVLDVSDNGLESLPDEITLLQNLQRFDLSNNYLSNLPYHIGFLRHLRTMRLEGNPLRLIRRDIVLRGTSHLLKYLASKATEEVTSYPGFSDYVPTEDIPEEKRVPDQYEMRNARAMVYNQKSKEVPDALFENGRLAGVRTADLSQNQLTEVPERLQDLSGCAFEVILKHNCLTSLPEFLGQFVHLQFIDLEKNRLDDLPQSLSSLKNLREVNIAFNRFERLPAVLSDIPSLEILFANENKISEIDVETLSRNVNLATLDLRNNNIGVLPPLLGRMTQIRSLQLEGNAFRVPRQDILAKGTATVLEYLRTRIVE